MRDPWALAVILLLIGAPILLYGCLQADQLVRAQYHSHRDDWERDGRPAGFFFWPPGFRRGFPKVWLFRTPAWVHTSPECLARLRRYRLCALVWNIICISIMVVVAKYVLAKKTSNHAMPFRPAQGPELAEGERTATRRAFTFCVASTLSLQATLSRGGRRSSCSR